MTTQNLIQPFHVIPGAVVKDILNGLRHATIDMVAQTHLTHERGETVNPDSYFLRFPAQPANRIIALPAAIVDSEGDQSVSGIKWIASYPYALLEGALISAVRTAASAVLGAWWLNGRNRHAPKLSIIGGGVISRNILETFVADDWSFDSVAQLIRGDLHVERDKPLIYSPFGMGILDLAIGRMIHNIAVAAGTANAIPSFFGEERRW